MTRFMRFGCFLVHRPCSIKKGAMNRVTTNLPTQFGHYEPGSIFTSTGFRVRADVSRASQTICVAMAVDGQRSTS